MGKSFWIAVEFLVAKILSQLSLVKPNISAVTKKNSIFLNFQCVKLATIAMCPARQQLIENAGVSWIMVE